MVAASELLMWVEIAVGLAVIGGFLWSAWRGQIRQVYTHINRIPAVEEKVERLCESNEQMKDAIIAEGYAIKYDGVVLEPESIEDDLRDDEGATRYITRAGDDGGDVLVRGGQSEND